METRLVRSRKDRILGGVCGGLGSYFHIDPTIVRLIFALSVFFIGISPIIYVILWVVMPEEPSLIVQPPAPPASLPQQDPTGEWRYDPYTGQPIRREQ
ncbi:MAG: PspC domain-containing protein [Chloroflexaceae bacterium]|nr:PspC domain-containing protein [Chloroflexaceae bacterium]